MDSVVIDKFEEEKVAMAVNQKILEMVGVAVGSGAGDYGCVDAPKYLKENPQIFADLKMKNNWHSIITEKSKQDGFDELGIISDLCHHVAHTTEELVRNKDEFVVVGGDHSCAIGTWSGVQAAVKQPIGLIWLDAHMDAHSHETSLSQNIHGMPVSALLGHGAKQITKIMHDLPKIQPDHLCLIGIRSFEPPEKELLDRLGVKVFMSEEVEKRGFDTVFQEALEIARDGTAGFGVSIDLDGFDPQDAPAVGTPVDSGFRREPVLKSLERINGAKDLLGLEIVEYNPHRDVENKTALLIKDIINAVHG